MSGPVTEHAEKPPPQKITPPENHQKKKRAVGAKGRKGEKDEWLKVETIKLTFLDPL